METRCIQSRKELPDMEEFKKAVQPLIEWVNKNCNPHERVVVKWDMHSLSVRKWDSHLRFLIEKGVL